MMNDKFVRQVQLAVYLISKFGDQGVPIVSVIKMMFLADVYAMRNYAISLTEDTYYAMKNGPVASTVDNIVEQNNEFLGDIDSVQYVQKFLERQPGNTWSIVKAKDIDGENKDREYLSELDGEILDYIFERYAQYAHDPSTLIEITHQYSAWKNKSTLNEVNKRQEMNIEDVLENDGDLQVSAEDIRMAREEYGKS